MTDKEFRHLSRAQLIDIIYQLQTKEEELTEENKRLKEALQDKRIRMQEAGNIASAALELNDVFQTAQKAADQYVAEMEAMLEDARQQVKQILHEAKEKAEAKEQA